MPRTEPNASFKRRQGTCSAAFTRPDRLGEIRWSAALSEAINSNIKRLSAFTNWFEEALIIVETPTLLPVRPSGLRRHAIITLQSWANDRFGRPPPRSGISVHHRYWKRGVGQRQPKRERRNGVSSIRMSNSTPSGRDRNLSSIRTFIRKRWVGSQQRADAYRIPESGSARNMSKHTTTRACADRAPDDHLTTILAEACGNSRNLLETRNADKPRGYEALRLLRAFWRKHFLTPNHFACKRSGSSSPSPPLKSCGKPDTASFSSESAGEEAVKPRLSSSYSAKMGRVVGRTSPL